MMEAYCVKCKTKREMTEAKPEYTVSGTAATRGKCPVCGTTLYRMGATPEHANIPKPDPVAKVDKPRKTRASKKNGNGKNGLNGPRSGKLVIVESPAKAKTIGRFLGKGYTVKPSVGHVRDLLRSTLSVDVEHDFIPKYRVPNEKKAVVKEIAALAVGAEEIFLATDPDREGEAIAWHLLEAAGIDRARTRRVVFHEITQEAVADAFAHPREIDMQLVNSQQARRILDRLVGYELSPLLWRKIRGRLSAGRVQSVTLRLIVEREREIQAFVPVEYWSIGAELAKQQKDKHAKKRQTFVAKLFKIKGQDVELKNESDTRAIVAELEKAAYQVANVKTGERRRKASPPFTTSTLQQEASRKLGFTAKRTMGVAQGLYEGVTLGEQGSVGLITYMRTDSTNVARVAQEEARTYIRERFGPEFIPAEPPEYKTKSKNAQEAHEAIRPTSAMRSPDSIKEYLDPAQLKLYDLIWKRFIASQMNPAIFDTVSVDIAAGEAKAISELVLQNGTAVYPYLFRASGSTLRFAGYLAVYEEAQEEDAKSEDDTNVRLPEMTAQELLDLIKLLPEQHFTEPPPRFSEATLVKTLEEAGIGRPSTYASILGVIDKRGYVDRVDKRLVPTEIGFTVNDMLVEYFPDVIEVGFTARMEEELDEIADGQKEWVPVIREFYEPFSKDLKHAEKNIEKIDMVETIDEQCPLSGHPLIIRYGRFGKFIGCSDFPNCRYTAPFLVKIGVKCPLDGGEIVEKKTKRGRIFFGCANYKTSDPNSCEFTSWNRPIPQPCPNDGGLLTMKNKDTAKCIRCENEYALSELPEAQLTV
jgi:DNA topoisomerase I